MSKDAPLAVVVPNAERDRPAWAKVGVIAAVGFILGIAWPRIVGVRLGPSAPGATATVVASSSASAGSRAPDAPPASVTAPLASGKLAPSASAAPPPPPAAAGGAPTVTVAKGLVLSCKTEGGETKKGKDCGPVPGIDDLVRPRIRKVATCSGAEGQSGKLSVTVNADFNSGRFWFDVAKGSTLPNVDAVTACLKTTFHGTSAAATPHEHPRYTVSYAATFAPPSAGDDDKSVAHKGDKASTDKAKDTPVEDKADRAEPAPKTSAGGEAEVGWEVALVRESPKTGNLVSRLPRGTKVKVGPTKDGWYQIKYGEGFANEGWVYRGAIGR